MSKHGANGIEIAIGEIEERHIDHARTQPFRRHHFIGHAATHRFGGQAGFGQRFIIGRITQLIHVGPAVQQRRAERVALGRRVGDQAGNEGGIGKQTALLVKGGALGPIRMQAERIEGEIKAEQHTDRPRRHLRLHRQPRGCGLFEHVEQFAPAHRRDRRLGKAEAERPARGLAQPAHHGEFRHRISKIGNELQHAFPGPAQRQRDAHQFVLSRRQRWGRLAIGRAVIEGARSGKAHRAGVHRRFGQRRHLRDIVHARLFAIGAAFAHHEHAQRRVRQLQADIHVEGAASQAVEIFGEALPIPRQAVLQHREGQILHAFHQPDQPILILHPARRETDAAIAGNHRGNAVPG